MFHKRQPGSFLGTRGVDNEKTLSVIPRDPNLVLFMHFNNKSNNNNKQ